MTSKPSTHTRMASSLIVRSVYVPGAKVTVPEASRDQWARGTPASVGRYHSKSSLGRPRGDAPGSAALNGVSKTRAVSVQLKNLVFQSMAGSKRPYENRYSAPTPRFTPRGDTVEEPRYSSVISQSPTMMAEPSRRARSDRGTRPGGGLTPWAAIVSSLITFPVVSNPSVSTPNQRLLVTAKPLVFRARTATRFPTNRLLSTA